MTWELSQGEMWQTGRKRPMWTIHDGATEIASWIDDESNAHLLHAAKEMLGALEMVVVDCQMPTAAHMSIVQGAIAMAKGKT